MAERLRADAFLSNVTGNKVAFKWAPPDNGQVPKGAYKEAVIRTAHSGSHPEYYIGLSNDSSGELTVMPFYAESLNNLSKFSKFLVADQQRLIWRQIQPGGRHLPPKAIRCDGRCKYGNMYVGRYMHGLGSVVFVPDKRSWTFVSAADQTTSTENFQVLCTL